MRLRALDEHGYHAYLHAACDRDAGWAAAAMVPTADGPLACATCGYREDAPTTGRLVDGFDVVHRQWGLRGDPYLWQALRDRVAEVPTPADPAAYLWPALRGITGVDLAAAGQPDVHIGAFARGGMSSGWVMAAWWRDKGVPLVVERATR